MFLFGFESFFFIIRDFFKNQLLEKTKKKIFLKNWFSFFLFLSLVSSVASTQARKQHIKLVHTSQYVAGQHTSTSGRRVSRSRANAMSAEPCETTACSTCFVDSKPGLVLPPLDAQLFEQLRHSAQHDDAGDSGADQRRNASASGATRGQSHNSSTSSASSTQRYRARQMRQDNEGKLLRQLSSKARKRLRRRPRPSLNHSNTTKSTATTTSNASNNLNTSAVTATTSTTTTTNNNETNALTSHDLIDVYDNDEAFGVRSIDPRNVDNSSSMSSSRQQPDVVLPHVDASASTQLDELSNLRHAHSLLTDDTDRSAVDISAQSINDADNTDDEDHLDKLAKIDFANNIRDSGGNTINNDKEEENDSDDDCDADLDSLSLEESTSSTDKNDDDATKNHAISISQTNTQTSNVDNTSSLSLQERLKIHRRVLRQKFVGSNETSRMLREYTTFMHNIEPQQQQQQHQQQRESHAPFSLQQHTTLVDSVVNDSVDNHDNNQSSSLPTTTSPSSSSSSSTATTSLSQQHDTFLEHKLPNNYLPETVRINQCLSFDDVVQYAVHQNIPLPRITKREQPFFDRPNTILGFFFLFLKKNWKFSI